MITENTKFKRGTTLKVIITGELVTVIECFLYQIRVERYNCITGKFEDVILEKGSLIFPEEQQKTPLA